MKREPESLKGGDDTMVGEGAILATEKAEAACLPSRVVTSNRTGPDWRNPAGPRFTAMKPGKNLPGAYKERPDATRASGKSDHA
jgi:hypothetical protein